MPAHSSGLLASRSARLQPFLEGTLCLAGGASGWKASDTNVFVEVRPVDAFATTDQTPVRTLRGRPMSKAGVPRQRDANGAAVDEIDDQSIVCDGHLLSKGRPQLAR
jgi:hypothetical protein